MTSIEQRAALRRQIWQIGNDVRGSVDGWDLEQYVLDTPFYHFISENFTSHMEAGGDSIDYAQFKDLDIDPAAQSDAFKTKGYSIYPSQLLANVAQIHQLRSDIDTIVA